MRDISPLLHAVAAVAAQAAYGFISEDWITGGLLGCIWFIALESKIKNPLLNWRFYAFIRFQ